MMTTLLRSLSCWKLNHGCAVPQLAGHRRIEVFFFTPTHTKQAHKTEEEKSIFIHKHLISPQVMLFSSYGLWKNSDFLLCNHFSGGSQPWLPVANLIVNFFFFKYFSAQTQKNNLAVIYNKVRMKKCKEILLTHMTEVMKYIKHWSVPSMGGSEKFWFYWKTKKTNIEQGSRGYPGPGGV